MKPRRNRAAGDAFSASSRDIDMANRNDAAQRALEFMLKTLELLDGVEAHVPAARLQHTIDILIGELEVSVSKQAYS